jgi:tetratricopeptide (TPR) repeat protein
MYEWYDGASSWLARAIEMNRRPSSAIPIPSMPGSASRWSITTRVACPKRSANLLAVVQADPRHMLAHLRLGMIGERTGHLQDALSQYQAAAALRPHEDDPWRFLGALQRKLGDVEAAQTSAINVIEITSRKIEASLDDVVLMSRLGEAYARFGGKEETHAIVRRVLELDPSDGLAMYYCACAHCHSRGDVIGAAVPAARL